MSEREIMQYELVKVYETTVMRAVERLNECVNVYISKGWKLYGNPIVLGHGVACQAMIKEKELEEREPKTERPSGQVLI